ncbi:unnamed protein product [Sphagnum balticum]
MNDNGAKDWRIAMTNQRYAQIAVELGVCLVCPIPFNVDFVWTTVHSDGLTTSATPVSIDVLLAIPMFARLYLVCRAMLLHSRMFTDALSHRYARVFVRITSPCSIGGLNRVNFNARFVLKTLMTLYPGTVLLVIIASYWLIASWTLRNCERHHFGTPPQYENMSYTSVLRHATSTNSFDLLQTIVDWQVDAGRRLSALDSQVSAIHLQLIQIAQLLQQPNQGQNTTGFGNESPGGSMVEENAYKFLSACPDLLSTPAVQHYTSV